LLVTWTNGTAANAYTTNCWVGINQQTATNLPYTANFLVSGDIPPNWNFTFTNYIVTGGSLFKTSLSQDSLSVLAAGSSVSVNTANASFATNAQTAYVATNGPQGNMYNGQGNYLMTIPKIPVRLYLTWFKYGTNYSITTISNDLAVMNNLGIQKAWTSGGIQPVYLCDSGMWTYSLDVNGSLTADPNRFPPNGYTYSIGNVLNLIHTNGWRAGVYCSAGINDTTTPYTPYLSNWFSIYQNVVTLFDSPGELGNNHVDYIKYDYNGSGYQSPPLTGMMNRAIALCPDTQRELEVTDQELSQYNGLTGAQALQPIENLATVSTANYLECGNYNNVLTMASIFKRLQMGQVHGYVDRVGCKVNTAIFLNGMAVTDYKYMMTVACSLGSSMQLGDTNPVGILYITNQNALAIQADSGWLPGTNMYYFSTSPTQVVCYRPLQLPPPNNTKSFVSVWNFDSSPHTYSLYATNFGWPAGSAMTVTEMWTNTIQGTYADPASVTVAANDVGSFVVNVLPITNTASSFAIPNLFQVVSNAPWGAQLQLLYQDGTHTGLWLGGLHSSGTPQIYSQSGFLILRSSASGGLFDNDVGNKAVMSWTDTGDFLQTGNFTNQSTANIPTNTASIISTTNAYVMTTKYVGPAQRFQIQAIVSATYTASTTTNILLYYSNSVSGLVSPVAVAQFTATGSNYLCSPVLNPSSMFWFTNGISTSGSSGDAVMSSSMTPL
jgi:hypothetical protein